MKRTTLLSALVAAGALLLAGCGDETAGSATTSGGAAVSAGSGEETAGGGLGSEETGMGGGSGEETSGGGLGSEETGMGGGSGEETSGGGLGSEETEMGGGSGEETSGGGLGSEETGMGGGESGGASGAELDSDTEQWFDTFCTSLAPVADVADLQSKLDPSDPKAMVATLSDVFKSIGAAFTDGADQLGAIPAPTFDGGEEFAQEIVSTFGDAGPKFTDLAEKFATLDPTDPQAAQELTPALSELQTAFKPLQEMNSLNIDPAVQMAIGQIPSCQELQKLGG